ARRAEGSAAMAAASGPGAGSSRWSRELPSFASADRDAQPPRAPAARRPGEPAGEGAAARPATPLVVERVAEDAVAVARDDHGAAAGAARRLAVGIEDVPGGDVVQAGG